MKPFPMSLAETFGEDYVLVKQLISNSNSTRYECARQVTRVKKKKKKIGEGSGSGLRVQGEGVGCRV